MVGWERGERRAGEGERVTVNYQVDTTKFIELKPISLLEFSVSLLVTLIQRLSARGCQKAHDQHMHYHPQDL
jgi:hypothetical protein